MIAQLPPSFESLSLSLVENSLRFWFINESPVKRRWKMKIVFYFCNWSMFCYALLYVHSSFAIIFMRKRELVALLSLSTWCLVIAAWLFIAVPWVCLQFVIVVLPNHTHLLFL